MTFHAYDHPEAREEYLDAIAHYERVHAGLGKELMRRFEGALADILHDPLAWTPLPGAGDNRGRPRSHRVKTFRYRIIYDVIGTQVRVLAYAHTSRAPGYWQHRASTSG